MVVKRASMSVLPEGCIANILSFTDPREACRSSVVSSIFKDAAGSDTVWERFLPPDYHSIVSHSYSSFLLHRISSKKQLYLSLCDNPILLNDGKMSFSLEKSSGKKCYMISARGLKIVWGDIPDYWRWKSDKNSRFAESAFLRNVCWLEISAKISTRMLSKTTTYCAFLVFKLSRGAYGLNYRPLQVAAGLVDTGTENTKRSIYLNFADGSVKVRGDGWLEIELGDFFNKEGEDGDLEMSVMEVEGGHWKHGLIVQGVEIRPKAAM